jgi:hypothetical protein
MADDHVFMLQLADGAEYGPATLAMVEQWAAEGRVPREALLRPIGSDAPPLAVTDVPRLAARVLAPPTISAGARPAPEGPLGAMIPARNAAALIGYYLSLFSIIPGLVVLAPVGVVLGALGLRAVNRTPEVRGGAHAWFAVLFGVFVMLINAGLMTLLWRGW